MNAQQHVSSRQELPLAVPDRTAISSELEVCELKPDRTCELEVRSNSTYKFSRKKISEDLLSGVAFGKAKTENFPTIQTHSDSVRIARKRVERGTRAIFGNNSHPTSGDDLLRLTTSHCFVRIPNFGRPSFEDCSTEMDEIPVQLRAFVERQMPFNRHRDQALGSCNLIVINCD